MTVIPIALNTFRETLRQPIYFLLLLTALVMIGFFPTLTLFVFREQVKLVVDSALATMMLFGWGMAVLCANNTVSREIANGTVLMVLSKPVNRQAFLAAKILGILAALALFAGLAGLGTLVAVRVARDQFALDNTAIALYFGALALGCAAGGLNNYFTRRSFPMAATVGLLVLVPLATLVVAAIPPQAGVERLRWGLAPALALIGFSTLALGALATALSTRLDMVPNLVVCGCIFLLGLVSDYLFGRFAGSNPFAFLAYNLVPNWQLFWMADALAADRAIPWSYVGWGALYTTLCLLLFTILAAVLFREREVGCQNQ